MAAAPAVTPHPGGPLPQVNASSGLDPLLRFPPPQVLLRAPGIIHRRDAENAEEPIDQCNRRDATCRLSVRSQELRFYRSVAIMHRGVGADLPVGPSERASARRVGQEADPYKSGRTSKNGAPGEIGHGSSRWARRQ